jgi:Zn-finger nucleic acid-binding protein
LIVTVNAQTLHCSSCGAPVSSDAPVCQHCGARLATISCPACFGMMFLGSKFCPHCGSAAADWQSDPVDLLCPACQKPMFRGKLGGATLHECGACFGLWLDTDTFAWICRSSEQQSEVLGRAGLAGGASAGRLGPVRYVRCPRCHELMNRVNFAQCSGVVVDVCCGHGTWFDMHELQRIVQFIRAGGLDRARERKKTELQEERRRLRAVQREAAAGAASSSISFPERDLLSVVVGATGDLLTHWLKH